MILLNSLIIMAGIWYCEDPKEWVMAVPCRSNHLRNGDYDIRYGLGRWDGLVRFLEYGRVEIVAPQDIGNAAPRPIAPPHTVSPSKKRSADGFIDRIRTPRRRCVQLSYCQEPVTLRSALTLLADGNQS
jgi:hypothetical protein